MVNRVYCELEDVKRLLRTKGVRESRVRFSSSYKELKENSSNNGSISLSGVSFLDSFASHETFSFTFTDTTSFDVTGDMTGTIGSGTVIEIFTSVGKFTVPVANWSGSAQSGDICYITSNSDVSEDDGHEFIVDATRFINSKLQRAFGSLSKLSFTDSTSVEVPDGVVYACIRYTAYEIFNSVFAPSSTDEISPVERWKTMADEALGTYLEGTGDGPRWRARSSLITELGVEGVGEGVIDIEIVTDATNKDFER